MSDIKNLKILLHKLMKLSHLTEQDREKLYILIQRFDYYKKSIMQPLRNQHYINCVWTSDISQQVSRDFCSCYYIDLFPKKMCEEIVEMFGMDYMLHF